MGNLCSKCQRTSKQSASYAQTTDSRHSLESISLVPESSGENGEEQDSTTRITKPVLEPPVLQACMYLLETNIDICNATDDNNSSGGSMGA